MRLIFASGDVGGARALAPVAQLAAVSGHQAWVVQHGAIASDNEGRDVAWDWVAPADPQSLLTDLDPDMVVFASSVTDPMALNLALAGQAKGISTAHILDNWSNYAARLVSQTGQTLAPDVYAVMDDLAAESAKLEGLNPASLVVTGTPALAHVKAQIPAPKGGIIFASEPVSMDQGRDPTQPGYRGYTEDQVLGLLLHALQPWASQIDLQVFLHPREQTTALSHVIQKQAGAVPVQVLTAAEKPAALAKARAIIGMCSILLYDSWLAGLPTLSLQPGLRLPHLRYLEGRPGLICVDDPEQTSTALSRLLDTGSPDHQRQASKERARHQGASLRVLTALSDCLRARIEPHG